MAKSLPPVSAKVIADAEQFIAEFKRADNAAKRSSANIDKEVGQLTKNLKRKFGVADFGKDLLRGFGIGSGFAVAEKAAEMITGYYERAAKAAQEMEASTAKQLENTLALIGLHQTDAQQLAVMDKEHDRLARALADSQAPKTEIKSTVFAGQGGVSVSNRVVSRDATKEEIKLTGELAIELGKLDLARDKLRTTVNKAADEQLVKNASLSKTLSKIQLDYEGADEALARGVEEAAKWNEELDKIALAYKEIADPSLRFKLQLEELNNPLIQARLSADELAAAIKGINKAMADDEASRVDKALKDFFEPLDEQQKLLDDKAKKTTKSGQEMGYAFESAFEGAILEGQKLSGVLDGLIKDIAKIALRNAITAPLGNWIGGMFSGLFGGGKAAGGPVDSGTSYLVGEKGPEILTMGASPGNITPNHALGGGNQGGTYYIDARGADQSGLAQLSETIRQLNGSIESRALNAVMGARRRGAMA